MTKWIYKFGGGSADGNKTMKQLLGGKGANLAEMAGLGLRVPPGFTITTDCCQYYAKNGFLPDDLQAQIQESMEFLQAQTSAVFGDRCTEGDLPLLVSVRSGAAISMPGMMDTVLNLGLNEKTAAALLAKTGNPRFVYDAYRRFVDMFGDVVCGVSHEKFEEAMQAMKDRRGVKDDIELSADDLKELVTEYKGVFEKGTGTPFPEDPGQQLHMAIMAVFRSWNNPRAIKYRKINKITSLKGTAVNVQYMAYGNFSDNSGTGVLFTRNPSTGENKLYGEYLIKAQGEDVVAGIRTPLPISTLEDRMPEVYRELYDSVKLLEKHMKNVQDCEFTVQEGVLYMLQTRDGKRTGKAAVQIAVDMVHEGVVTKRHAVEHLVTPAHIDQLLHPSFTKASRAGAGAAIAKGLAASPGAAVGQVVMTADEAEEWVAAGKKVILVRQDTSAEDVGGMHVSEGIVTSRGGMTSHAAVVARGWGKPCVAGCGDLVVNMAERVVTAPGGKVVREGDWISIDGSTGEVLVGRLETEPPAMEGTFVEFMSWADEVREMQVLANADTGPDVARAIELGANGVGLVRTEHMFLIIDRLMSMRRMLVADTAEERQDAVEHMIRFQTEDFISIFQAAGGRPVTVRLLDPPLHEFLPKEPEAIETLAKELGKDVAEVDRKIRAHQELNPMLGHRGCRVGVTHTEVTEMQVRAILLAARQVRDETGVTPEVEIMVPLVALDAELEHQRALIEATARTLENCPPFKVGSMIETPRAAIIAYQLAKHADFFSFGTNDLTQMTLAFSRDDMNSFVPNYMELGILKDDPFQTVDQQGVGKLVFNAVRDARRSNPGIRIGVCGEHGGDEKSIKFFFGAGVDYVSCSPLRVPLARLAAAQATLAREDTVRSVALIVADPHEAAEAAAAEEKEGK
eukprot:CAMPEP_0196771110 /NCGR_PEP_ID=MMETSP1104-20130614/1504_1 /TAXON_ID=33652 /ORGANISM="Cafeteria sp., Strain Caron Lab Isolate" /LENGTH=907 /DNA_ID=CAMNT_0042141227 /DNA_START=33 /DNA_END=2756 /DNA_ORIENTATION=+